MRHLADTACFDSQGFIQKILFGVEGGVALSHTVAPHEVLHNVFLYINLILVIIREMLLTYIIIPKYMLPPPLSHFPLPLSLSLSPFLFPSLFLLGGKLGSLGGGGGKLPPCPPL